VTRDGTPQQGEHLLELGGKESYQPVEGTDRAALRERDYGLKRYRKGQGAPQDPQDPERSDMGEQITRATKRKEVEARNFLRHKRQSGGGSGAGVGKTEGMEKKSPVMFPRRQGGQAMLKKIGELCPEKERANSEKGRGQERASCERKKAPMEALEIDRKKKQPLAGKLQTIGKRSEGNRTWKGRR